MTKREHAYLDACEWIAKRISLRLGRFCGWFLWTYRTVNRDGWAEWWEERSPRKREPKFWIIPLSQGDLEYLAMRQWSRDMLFPGFRPPRR